MKLLILTQKIDINDDLLGFMHGWVAEFARHFESIIVVALSAGEYSLPENVKVFSLGKASLVCHSRPLRRSFSEASESGNLGSGSRVPPSPRLWRASKPGMTNGISKKLKYVFNFFRYIWRERKNYDTVLVHMNKEYLVLGGLFWRFWGKKTALWYNHKKGNIISNLAGCLAGQIFYTSPFSFFAKWPKAQIMPVGIDTNLFKPDLAVEKNPASILFLGRISPVKKVEVLVEALGLLKKEGVNFNASIIGDAPERDKQYGEEINQRIKKLNLSDQVKIKEKIPNWQAPAIFNQHEIFVNLTPSGSMDKTIFEAMACGCLVLAANKSLAEEVGSKLLFENSNPVDLADKIKNALQLDATGRVNMLNKLREFVVKKHSLNFLAERLKESLK